MPYENSYRMWESPHIYTQMKLRSSPLADGKKFATAMESVRHRQSLIAHFRIVPKSISER